MATAELDGDEIAIRIHPREVHLVRQVPGVRWRAKEQRWVAHLSWASCVALRGVFGDRLEVGPGLGLWAAREKKERIAPALAMRSALRWEDLEPPARDGHGENWRGLYSFQKVGALFLTTAERAILADEMGTGKTVQAIAALRELDARPALVVCPNSMKLQWQREIVRWWPHATAVVVGGGAAKRRAAIDEVYTGRADVAIINWEALRSHSRLLGYYSVVALARCEAHGGDGNIPESRCEVCERELNEIEWRAVVADEAHRAKDPRAKQTRALWAVARDARYRFALTGTPILNAPDDLWSLGHFVDPNEWPVKTAWLERYALTGFGVFGGLEILGLRHDTRDELFRFLDPRFLRRTKAQVLPQLPPKVYTRRLVELGSKERKAYNDIRDEMLAELDDGELTYVTNALTKMTRLRQFASAYAKVVEEPCSPKCAEGGHQKCRGTETIRKLRMTLPSAKVDALEELAEELGGKPAVVFAESRQLIELAAERLRKRKFELGLVTGGQTPDERDDVVEAFQRGDLQLVLATLGAGGEGITLTAADTAIFLQRSFSLAKNRQAEDRIHRSGQEAESVEIVDVVAADTVDDGRVEEILAEKGEKVEEVVRDRETFRRLLA